MLQSGVIDEFLVAIFYRTFECRFYIVEDMNAQQVISYLKLPREGFRAVSTFLRVKDLFQIVAMRLS